VRRLPLSTRAARQDADEPATPLRELRAPLLAGVALTVASWAFVSFTPALRDWLYGDARLYDNWGTLIAAHQVPYRDFRLEYPPGALPSFVAPLYVRKVLGYYSTYFFWFRVEIAFLAVLSLAAMAHALSHLRASRRRAWAALCAAGVAPVVLGPIEFFHYDAWPTLFAVAALAALLAGRGVLSCALAAAGAVAKVFPAVLIPLALFELWRRARWRGVAAGLGAALAVVVVTVAPFAVVGPHGISWALRYEARRPLQVESVAATVFAAAHELAGGTLQTVQSFGSRNLVGHGADTAASLLGALTVLALIGIYAAYLRSRRGREELVLAAVAAVTAYVVFSKVFSPQYLVWLIPLVPLIGGRDGVRATALFLAILGVTQIWEPYHYDHYYRFTNPWLVWLVIGRNVLVVALLVLVVRPLLRRARDPAEASSTAARLDYDLPGRP
jgi:hypothetical protein